MPEKIVGLPLILDFFDRGANPCSLYPPPAAERLQAMIGAEMPTVEVRVSACRGLCSYYAEKDGLLVGLEEM